MASSNVRLLRREPYRGTSLGIVIGIDVGTTFSGVSYAILRPGELPEILPVTRFSSLSAIGSKIPSVILYDKNLQIRAIGAQTVLDIVLVDAETEEWVKAEHFKLHFQSNETTSQTLGFNVSDLPEGKTAEEVMGDYLRYLHEETASYIKICHSDGSNLWDEVKDKAIFVLGHPNGWKGVPQQRYRTSAVLGGLIQDTAEGHARVKFVTEGEASALACLSGGLGPPSLDPGFKFVIADAGGGTVDVSTFEVTQSSPVQLKECIPPEGRAAGSVFVNYSARKFVEEKLRGTKYDNESTLHDILDNFESKTKQEFTGGEAYVKVGDRRARDPRLDIAMGFMNLSAETMRLFFSHSVSGLVDAVNHQLSASGSNRKNMPIWLVGGFGSSQYLLRALQSAFTSDGVTVQSPDTSLAKAVANGAVLHYIDNTITSRVCDSNYGTTALIPFNPMLPEHRERIRMIRNDPDGLYIGPLFSCIARKNTPIGAEQIFSKKFYREIPTKQIAKNFSTELMCLDGDSPPPKWYAENEDKFRGVCKLQADLSELCCELTLVQYKVSLGPLRFETLRSYWRIEFEIELKFGTTELEAAIKWDMNGETKCGPVRIIHNTCTM